METQISNSEFELNRPYLIRLPGLDFGQRALYLGELVRNSETYHAFVYFTILESVKRIITIGIKKGRLITDNDIVVPLSIDDIAAGEKIFNTSEGSNSEIQNMLDAKNALIKEGCVR